MVTNNELSESIHRTYATLRVGRALKDSPAYVPEIREKIEVAKEEFGRLMFDVTERIFAGIWDQPLPFKLVEFGGFFAKR